jgi:signal transduction histidine kinase
MSNNHYEALIEEVENLIRLATFEERTPLTTIVGYADYLLSGQLGALTDEQQQAIENMRTAAKRRFDSIKFLTDELMLLNLLHERTKLDLARIEIQEWLKNITRGFAKVLESKNQRPFSSTLYKSSQSELGRIS